MCVRVKQQPWLNDKGAASSVHHAAPRVVLIKHLCHGFINGTLCIHR